MKLLRIISFLSLAAIASIGLAQTPSVGVRANPSTGAVTEPSNLLISIDKGGTGQVTASAAFDAIKQSATTSSTGVVELATSAETLTGTDTARAVTPKSLTDRLVWSGTAPPRGHAISDGVTPNRAEILIPGAIGAVAGLPMSFIAEVDVSTSNPSVSTNLASLCTSVGDSNSQTNSFEVRLTSAGALGIIAHGASNPADYRQLLYAGFRAAYSGQRGRLEVKFTEGDSTTDPVILWNGVDITSSFTLTTAGTPPNWMDASLVSTYFLAGYNWPAGRVPYVRAIIGALSSTESATWGTTGELPAWATFAGSAVNRLTNGDSEAGVIGGSAFNVTASQSSASPYAGSFATRLLQTSGTNLYTLTGTGLVFGRSYRLKGFARGDGTVAPKISRQTSGQVYWTGSPSTSWQPFDLTIVGSFGVGTLAEGQSIQLRIDTGGTDGVSWVEFDSMEFIELGPLDAHSYQPALATYDRFGRMSRRLLGFTPVSSRDTVTIIGNTATNGNEQLLGGAILSSANDITIDQLEQATATGTPTTTVGSASGGAQYKASGALSAGLNVLTPVTRKPASTSVWVGSNDTTNVRTIIHGHKVSTPTQ